MSTRRLVLTLLVFSPVLAWGEELSPHVRGFVRVAAPRVALTHVRVIDGTGAAPAEDQTVVVADGRIAAILPGSISNRRGVVRLPRTLSQ